MDVNSIAALATEMSQQRTAQQASLSVLKIAMNLEAQNGQQLVQMAAQAAAPAPSGPVHLGNQVNTFA